eukprot:CAMPEP_0114164872 /NCGR_PEP_ID=MMETSP0043_2-20121206/30920_1 /TAXON_ID=464988 /ORGANISM="Hemiselmis andersenii, Strain CCMP644" /LENGTH=70 /DNA_ID=CAMNT_0001261603 /DNA_START=1 /DNA_END=210 /DNA_ORIENTATION=-
MVCRGCKVKVCEWAAVLSKEHCWVRECDDEVQQAYLVNSLLEGSHTVGASYSKALAQGRMDVAAVYCACG